MQGKMSLNMMLRSTWANFQKFMQAECELVSLLWIVYCSEVRIDFPVVLCSAVAVPPNLFTRATGHLSLCPRLGFTVR